MEVGNIIPPKTLNNQVFSLLMYQQYQLAPNQLHSLLTTASLNHGPPYAHCGDLRRGAPSATELVSPLKWKNAPQTPLINWVYTPYKWPCKQVTGVYNSSQTIKQLPSATPSWDLQMDSLVALRNSTVILILPRKYFRTRFLGWDFFFFVPGFPPLPSNSKIACWAPTQSSFLSDSAWEIRTFQDVTRVKTVKPTAVKPAKIGQKTWSSVRQLACIIWEFKNLKSNAFNTKSNVVLFGPNKTQSRDSGQRICFHHVVRFLICQNLQKIAMSQCYLRERALSTWL